MIIAVDFDGTLCVDEWPDIGYPNFTLIDYLKKRKENGDKIILWTNRCGEPLENAIKWCKRYGIELDAVNENLPEIIERFGSDCRKIYADLFIDDRNFIPCTLPYIKPVDVEW